jgi:hypothetical protein
MRSMVWILENPKSFAVLHNLFFDKEKYSDKELKSLMNLFSNEIKLSTSYNKLKEYLNKKIDLEKNGFSQKFNWFDVNGNNYNFEMALNKKKYAFPCAGIATYLSVRSMTKRSTPMPRPEKTTLN